MRERVEPCGSSHAGQNDAGSFSRGYGGRILVAMPDHVERRAYAKVNLSLSVGPPEPVGAARAGWHPIASWMHAIDLWDELELSKTSGESGLEVTWAANAPRPTPIDWAMERDLAARAQRALEGQVGRTLPTRGVLRKRIPVAAGLGGGSSDAAAMLLGLRELHDLDVSDETLRTIGAGLGSDVPFFLDTGPNPPPPRPAIVEGFGEVVERVARSSAKLVLLVPPFSCSTPAVYAAFDEILEEERKLEAIRFAAMSGARAATGRGTGRAPLGQRVRAELIRERLARMKGKIKSDLLFNDLEPAAYRVEPRLGEMVTALARVTRETVHVTGSGSAVFIVADDAEATTARARRVMPEGGVAMGVALV